VPCANDLSCINDVSCANDGPCANWLILFYQEQRDPRLNEILFPHYTEARVLQLINQYETDANMRKNSNCSALTVRHWVGWTFNGGFLQNGSAPTDSVGTSCRTKMPPFFSIDWTCTRIWTSRCVITSLTHPTIPTSRAGNSAANRPLKCTGRRYWLDAGTVAPLNRS
jgi:hypothetical protein